MGYCKEWMESGLWAFILGAQLCSQTEISVAITCKRLRPGCLLG